MKGSLIRVGERLLIPGRPTGTGGGLASADVRIAGHESASRHRVRKGESLWLIARRYGVPVANLVAWNRLDPEAWLMPGQTLRLRAPASEPMTIATRDEETRYVVRNGDNLWLIARRHGVSVADLRAWNALSPDEWLMPGQILALSGAAERTPPAVHRLAQPGRPGSICRARRRQSLADRASIGVSVNLRAWNGIEPAEWLMPGQTLLLRDSSGAPTSAPSGAATDDEHRYVVRSGDSLWRIARRHSISTAQLASWNELSINGVLQPGQTLQVAPPAPETGEAPSTNSL